MKPGFYARPDYQPFYLYCREDDTGLHLAMLSGVTQIAIYVVASDSVKENVMSHTMLEINPYLEFLVAGVCVTTPEDAIDMMESSIEAVLETLQDGVTLRNTDGFLVLHKKPEQFIGTVFICEGMSKSNEKLIRKMCSRLAKKYKSCALHDAEVDVGIAPTVIFQGAGLFGGKRDTVCQSLLVEADKILDVINQTVGEPITDISCFEAALSETTRSIAYSPSRKKKHILSTQ